MTTLAHLTPYAHPNLPVVTEPRLQHLTDAELASLDRQSPGLLDAIRRAEIARYGIEPVAYDNGVPADGLSA